MNPKTGASAWALNAATAPLRRTVRATNLHGFDPQGNNTVKDHLDDIDDTFYTGDDEDDDEYEEEYGEEHEDEDEYEYEGYDDDDAYLWATLFIFKFQKIS